MSKAVSDGPGRPRKLFDRNIAKDRKVSKFHLDRAAEEQADAFGYWSDLKPKARKKVENLELDLDIKTGERFKYYKEALDGGVDAKGNKKLPTDTMVNNAIFADEEIIKIKRDIIENQEYLGLIESAMKTMDQRRSSIKVLESLNHDSYFESQGKTADDYNARESNKDKIKHAKNEIGKGLQKIKIPEEGLEVEEEIDHDVPEETFDPETVDVTDHTVEDSDNIESEEVIPEEEEGVEESEETETEEKSSDEDNPCPYNHKIGADFGLHNDCDECDAEGVCYRESKKL